jgi:hypothetical protein
MARDTFRHFVGTYTDTVIQKPTREGFDTNVVAAAQQVEAQPHFLGRFTQTIIHRPAINSWEQAPPLAQEPWNPHFLGKFSPYPIQTTAAFGAYFKPPQDNSSLESNPHFLGRFTQTSLYRQYPPSFEEAPPLAQTDPDPHFRGRFSQTIIYRPAINSWEMAPPVAAVVEPPFNPHFRGRFSQTIIYRNYRYVIFDVEPCGACVNHFEPIATGSVHSLPLVSGGNVHISKPSSTAHVNVSPLVSGGKVNVSKPSPTSQVNIIQPFKPPCGCP